MRGWACKSNKVELRYRGPGGSAPPALARCEMRFDDVLVQLDTESRLVGDLHETVFDVGTVENQHLIHPSALSGDCFARDVVATRREPPARATSEHIHC